MKNKKIFALFALALISLPVLVLADAYPITNPLNYNTIKELLVHIADGAMAVIGALSTVMLLFAGGLFLFSHGEPENITKAKKAVLYAIIGIVIVIARYAIVDLIMWITTGSPT